MKAREEGTANSQNSTAEVIRMYKGDMQKDIQAVSGLCGGLDRLRGVGGSLRAHPSTRLPDLRSETKDRS